MELVILLDVKVQHLALVVALTVARGLGHHQELLIPQDVKVLPQDLVVALTVVVVLDRVPVLLAQVLLEREQVIPLDVKVLPQVLVVEPTVVADLDLLDREDKTMVAVDLVKEIVPVLVVGRMQQVDLGLQIQDQILAHLVPTLEQWVDLDNLLVPQVLLRHRQQHKV